MNNDFEILEVTDLDEAKKWWNIFSPAQTIYDFWDFRYIHFKYFNTELRFFVGFLNKKPIGLLPLQFDKEKQVLQFFGGINMECNHVFIDENYTEFEDLFYQSLDKNFCLTNISSKKLSPFKESNFIEQDKRFFLDLSTFTDIEDYYNKHFSRKSKNNLKSQFRKILANNLEVLEANLIDLDLLFDYNLKKYGSESTFLKPFRKDIYRDLVQLKDVGVEFYTFLVGGKKQGVSLALNYKKDFSRRLFGVSPDGVSNLWKFIIIRNIEKSKQLELDTFDIGTGDYGWKESWNFSSEYQYMYVDKNLNITADKIYNIGLN